jgi:hypothetical protein
MDISKQFSFTDFLAYFFPGAFATVGLYFLVLLSPVQRYFESITLDITTGLFFLILSYIIGVICSGLSSGVVKQIERLKHYHDIHSTIPDDIFPEEIINGYKKIMGISTKENIKWTNSHYRMCLSFVAEKMPFLAQRIDRQRNVALFRRNLVFPLIVWAIAGIGWGIWNIFQGSIGWGLTLSIFSLLASVFSIVETVNRMHHGIGVEVRETLSAFLTGCKLGVFNKSK